MSTIPPSPDLSVRTLSSLLGREDDLARVRELVARERARLVTLCGPPGVGKTRLALELYVGALFCVVADASSAEDFCRALARTLGVALREATSSQDHVARLGAALFACGRTVLVLDDVDVVLDEARPIVTELLLLAPETTIVATSRSRFRLAVEWIHEVKPLAIETESGAAGPAVDLFFQRSREVGGELTSADREAVTALVRRLDGLPLGIELAAARSTLMSPSELLEKLDEPMRLLTGAGRSLRASIGASWKLLSAAERQALTIACTLHGSFGLGFVEAACRALSLVDPLSTLQSLRERSLVQIAPVAPARAGERRWRAYESVRAFVVETVTDDERRQAMRAIGVAAGALAERCAASAWGPSGESSLRALLAEEANLESVLENAERACDEVDVRSVAAAIVHLREEHGPEDLTLAVLERVGDGESEGRDARGRAARARFDAASAAVLERAGQTDAADQRYASSLGAARDVGDLRLEGLILLRQAHGARVHGRAEQSRVALEAALVVASRTKDPVLSAIACRLEAEARQAVFDIDGGLEAVRQSIDHAKASLDSRLLTRALVIEAILLADGNEPAAALARALELRATAANAGETRTLGFACLVAGAAALELGQRRHADLLLAESFECNRRLGLARLMAYALAFAGVSAFEQRQLERADDAFATAAELLGPAAEPTRVAAVRTARGVLTALLGRPDQGRRIVLSVREAVMAPDRRVVDMLAIGLDAGSPHARTQLAAARAALLDERGHLPSIVLRLSHRLTESIVDAHCPPAHAVVFDAQTHAVCLPGGAVLLLEKKPMLWRLLCALASSHLLAAGERVTAEALVRSVWPDEKMSERAALNRLAVALHKLRRAGFDSLLEAGGGPSGGAAFHRDTVIVWAARPFASRRSFVATVRAD